MKLGSVLEQEPDLRFNFFRNMELLLVLIFASSLFQLTAEAKHVEAEEDEEEDDLFELPPDPNPVSGFAEGPLPKFIELNLQVKYDLTLLEWFGGSKEETENYVKSVLHLAEFHLQYTNLDIKIHIKVVLILHFKNKSIYVCLFSFLCLFSFIDIICPFLFVFQIVSIEHVAMSLQPNGKMVKTLMKNRFKSETAEQICYFSGKINVVIGLKSIQTKPK